jgi:predicted double-glycine peptidase
LAETAFATAKAVFHYLLPVTALALLTGCAHQPEARSPVVSLLEMRQQNVVVQKWDLSCGAAALATILKYQHQYPASEREIAASMLRKTDELKVKVRGGFSLLDLKRYVESRGLKGSGYRDVDLHNLIALAPAIVPVYLGDYNHFVVFRGLVDDRVLLADPAFGNRWVDVETFKQSWLEHIAFVVRRNDDQAPSNQLTVVPNDLALPPDSAVRNNVIDSITSF